MVNLCGGVNSGLVQPLTKIGEFRCSSKRRDTTSGCKKNFRGRLWLLAVCLLERYFLGQVGPIAPFWERDT